MNVSQRGVGNANILRKIQQASKKVSQELGYDKSMQVFAEQPKINESKLGAAASLGMTNNISQVFDIQSRLQEMISSGANQSMNRVPDSKQYNQFVQETAITPTINNSGNVKFDLTRSVLDRLIDNIEMLSTTKEYFNAVQSMFSLYALGYLDDVVFDKLSREDLKEIKGIVREFKSILDEY